LPEFLAGPKAFALFAWW